MSGRAWKILERGEVPLVGVSTIDYTCPNCEMDARLPVKGLPMAQMCGGGIVFDTGPHAMPAIIQCPYCRKRYEAY